MGGKGLAIEMKRTIRKGYHRYLGL